MSERGGREGGWKRTVDVLGETHKVCVALCQGGEGVVSFVGLGLESHVSSLLSGLEWCPFLIGFRDRTDICIKHPHQAWVLLPRLNRS